VTEAKNRQEFAMSISFQSRISSPTEMQYSRAAMRHDLAHIRQAWEACQTCRDRNAIYDYLAGVFDLVMWWKADRQEQMRARMALRSQLITAPVIDEPFAAIVFVTSDPRKVDKRTRSKWSRVLRYAASNKPRREPLGQFVRRKGGINKCAARYTRSGG
jgi:hypothetical protein